MRNKSETLAILGCGWLGLPLAETLIQQGYQVKGSTTTEEKNAVLTAKGIEAFQILLSDREIVGNIVDFLAGTDILIVAIPPKLRGLTPENYTRKIALLIPYLENTAIKKVLFISSTAVYPDEVSYNKVTEGYIPNPDTENGKQLFSAENLLRENNNFETTVLRFGGLIGKERHPVKQLSGKENIANPDAPINMIHLEDCVGIILKIIETESWGGLFNGVSPFHPKREEYYHKKAREMNLPLPKFAHDSPSVGKLISSEKVQQALKYSFGKTDF